MCLNLLCRQLKHFPLMNTRWQTFMDYLYQSQSLHLTAAFIRDLVDWMTKTCSSFLEHLSVCSPVQYKAGTTPKTGVRQEKEEEASAKTGA